MLSNSFRWTSRESTCESLVSFLNTQQTNSPNPDELRRERIHASRLLETFANPEVAPKLRALILDRREERWVRIHAIRALTALNLSIHARELSELIKELDSLYENDDPESGTVIDEESELLSLVQDQRTFEAAWRALAASTLWRRTQFLAARRSGSLDNEWQGRLCEQLYQQWLAVDRAQLPEELNDFIVRHTDERPESRRIRLDTLVASAQPPDRNCLRSVAYYPEFASLETSHPELWARARAELIVPGRGWPSEDSEEVSWPAGLLAELESEIQRISAVLSEPHEEPGPMPEGGEEQQQWESELRRIQARHRDLESRGHQAMNLLLDCEGGRARLEEILSGESLHAFFWGKLEDGLWKWDRQRAVSWAQAEISRGDSRKGSVVFCRLAAEPESADRGLLLAALTQAQPCFRYMALGGLERLGVAVPWEQRQALKEDPDAFVRLRMHGQLYRGGDQVSEALLVAAAQEAEDVCLRAEALRWIASANPFDHRELLIAALLSDHELQEGYYTPVAEEAAYGLAVEGSDEALSALIRGALMVPGNPVWDALIQYIRVNLARRDGEPFQETLAYWGHAPVVGPRGCPPPLPQIYPNLWRGTLDGYPGP